MRHDCDHLRRRALEHGEGTPEYDVWVRHSRHCAECSSELYIQGMLQSSDVRGTGSHLSSEDVSRLVQLADERYRGGRRRHARLLRGVFGIGWRVACVGLLAHGLAMYFAGWSKDKEPVQQVQLAQANRPALQDSAAPSSSSSSQLAASLPLASPEDPAHELMMNEQLAMSDEGGMSDWLVEQENLDTAREYGQKPEVLSGWSYERSIQNCRQRIKCQRDRLYESLERDSMGE